MCLTPQELSALQVPIAIVMILSQLNALGKPCQLLLELFRFQIVQIANLDMYVSLETAQLMIALSAITAHLAEAMVFTTKKCSNAHVEPTTLF
jgi:hypothetical protein